MALEKASDMQRRLLGALFFLPIITAIFAGNPFAFIAFALIACWLSAEFAFLLHNVGKIKLKGRLGAWLTGFIVMGSWCAGWASGVPSFGFGSLGILLLLMLAMFFLVGKIILFSAVLMSCLFALGWLVQFEYGISFLILLACMITASDVGAYICGKKIGGPKLAPAISPSKTWSGSIGGVISALGVSAMAFLFISPDSYYPLSDVFIWSGVVVFTLVGQVGDLYESWFKRKLNIKDTSHLIPGHGGVLDRFDGYLFALPLLAALLALN